MSNNQDLDDTRCTPESDRENMRATIAALRAEVEKLTREKDALHDSFVRLAHADKRTPLGIDDAAMLKDIDGGDWIVPKEIAAAIARLEAENAGLREECRKARAILGPFGMLRTGIIQEDGLMYEDARREVDAAGWLKEAP